MEKELPVEIPMWDGSTLFGVSTDYTVDISGTRQFDDDEWDGESELDTSTLEDRDVDEVPFTITVSHSAYRDEVPEINNEYIRAHLKEHGIEPESVIEIQYVDVTTETRLYDKK